MAQRRTPRGGPAGSRRPGERGGQQRARTSPAAATPPDSTGETPATPGVPVGSAKKRRRPRLTGRAAILVLVVAVLTVSYASSMRAYLQQRAHISDLKEQIASRQSAIDDLEREKQRWHDPAYVEQQARARFGYVMPGETSYVVLDENGNPLEADNTLPDASDVLKQTPTPWYSSAWASVKLAGDPPPDRSPATSFIDKPGSKQRGEGQRR